MVTRLSLVAHATTRDLRSATFGGDASLDDVGKRQADKLAGSLGKVDHVWTSPTARARETAAALGLAATVDERLRDCDFGRWTGLKFNQVMVREPFKLFSWIKTPATAPHGGETIPHVMERVAAWIRERSKDDGHTVAISTRRSSAPRSSMSSRPSSNRSGGSMCCRCRAPTCAPTGGAGCCGRWDR